MACELKANKRVERGEGVLPVGLRGRRYGHESYFMPPRSVAAEFAEPPRHESSARGAMPVRARPSKWLTWWPPPRGHCQDRAESTGPPPGSDRFLARIEKPAGRARSSPASAGRRAVR